MATQRYSKQRELIYQAVLSSREHPTAEMIYAALRQEHPNLSLGTVYRNLHLLADTGRIVRMPFPIERFDGDLSPHCHFRRRRCTAVSDIFLPYDKDLDALAENGGRHVEGHSIVFHGLCEACAKTEKAENPAAG